MNRLLQNWPHRWYGYFGLDKQETPQLPVLADVTDVNWRPHDKPSVVEYLKNGLVFVEAITSEQSICPLCGAVVGRNNTAHLSDNTWLWPEDLFHFVEVHDVVLPDAFLSHIRSQNYQTPAKLTIAHDHFKWPSQETESLEKYR